MAIQITNLLNVDFAIPEPIGAVLEPRATVLYPNVQYDDINNDLRFDVMVQNNQISIANMEPANTNSIDNSIRNKPAPIDTAAYGTVTVTAGTPNVVGVATWFTFEYVGAEISIGGEVHEILSITDNLNMTLVTNHAAGAAGVPFYTEQRNVALGPGALSSGAKWDNTAVGYKALENVADEAYSSAFGAGALMNNTGQGYNNAFGWRSLHEDVTGFGNAAFGDQTLMRQTGSEYNTAIGSLAMSIGNPGTANVAVGRSALKYGTGTADNVAVGRSACLYTAGAGNTGIGKDALHENLTGGLNIALGYRAGYDELGSGKLYIANGASAAETLIYGDFATRLLGLGTVTPAAALHVKGVLTTELTGTTEVTASTPNVVGTTTIFETELNVGDAIQILDEVFTISAIADDTHLTLDSNHVAGAAGVTAYQDPTLLNVQTGDAAAVFTSTQRGQVGVGTADQFGSGTGVIGLANAGVGPDANPPDGGGLYSEAGALKWRGASGTITTIALA